MVDMGETKYSPEIGIALLKKESEEEMHPVHHLNLTKLIIRRLDDFLSGNFNLLSAKEIPVSECYIEYFQNFLKASGYKD